MGLLSISFQYFGYFLASIKTKLPLFALGSNYVTSNFRWIFLRKVLELLIWFGYLSLDLGIPQWG